MSILQDLINLNELSISLTNLGGLQTWEWGRITSLNLSGNDGFGYIHTLPNNIEMLDKLI